MCLNTHVCGTVIKSFIGWCDFVYEDDGFPFLKHRIWDNTLVQTIRKSDLVATDG